MNALGESILSICYNECIIVDDVKVFHDGIEQYEDELRYDALKYMKLFNDDCLKISPVSQDH